MEQVPSKTLYHRCNVAITRVVVKDILSGSSLDRFNFVYVGSCAAKGVTYFVIGLWLLVYLFSAILNYVICIMRTYIAQVGHG